MKAENKSKIAILGSTGSIGTQCLDVVRANPDYFTVEVLTAGSNADLLIQQALEFMPNIVVISDDTRYDYVKEVLFDKGVKVFAGAKSIADVAAMEDIDIVVTALVGISGLESTISAISAGKQVALANKESLVVAGHLVNPLAKQHNSIIIPVDSEHSAIFQCLNGERTQEVDKIVLTASGGPFRGKDTDFLKTVTPAMALKHPNWSMGSKISIDSATLMNKGLEVIEAGWLFGLRPEQIEVIVHPQSVIHSFVHFIDGSIKAQLGVPDMRLPIQYALCFPYRLKANFAVYDYTKYPQLTFEKPDYEAFPCLGLAYEAMKKGGNIPCALNAANEFAVNAFLDGRTSFSKIPFIVENTIMKIGYIHNPGIDELLQTHENAVALSASFI